MSDLPNSQAQDFQLSDSRLHSLMCSPKKTVEEFLASKLPKRVLFVPPIGEPPQFGLAGGLPIKAQEWPSHRQGLRFWTLKTRFWAFFWTKSSVGHLASKRRLHISSIGGRPPVAGEVGLPIMTPHEPCSSQQGSRFSTLKIRLFSLIGIPGKAIQKLGLHEASASISYWPKR